MRPCLIHPVEVILERIDDCNTSRIDPDFREPVDIAGASFDQGVRLKAQITWGAKDEYRRSPGGDEYIADGHFTFLAAQLKGAGVTLHKGDRVSTPADDTYRYRIVSLRPAGHYCGRPTLLEAVFKRLEGND